MKDLFIPVLEGTTRPKRESIKVAKFVVGVANDIEGVRSELIDPVDFNFPGDGNDEENKDLRYTKIVKEADGFFIVVPEYNHGYPGTLKRMLDAELKHYIHKPVVLAGVSGGQWGGIRAVENIIPVVREIGMVVTFADVQFPKVGELFDDKGEIVDKKYVERVERSFEELVWMAKTLKWGRENLQNKYH